MNIRTSFSGLNGDALASMLNSRSWKYYTPEKRLELLQEVEIRAARSQGRDALVVKTFRTGRSKAGLMGYFTTGYDGCININENYVNGKASRLYDYSVASALGTLLHEGRHAYQYAVVEGRCPAPDAQTRQRWKLNFVGYSGGGADAQEQALYVQQSLERDARSYAMNALSGIHDQIRRTTGCDDYEYQRTLNGMQMMEERYRELAKTILTRQILDEVDRRVREAFERAYPGETLSVSIFDEFRRSLDRIQEMQIREIRRYARADSTLDRMICQLAERSERERTEAVKFSDCGSRYCAL